MELTHPKPTTISPSISRLALPSLLGLLLLLLGTFLDQAFTYLDRFYAQVFQLIGLSGFYETTLKQAFDLKILTLILINATFCVLILLLLFRDRTRRKIIVWSHAAMIILALSFALLVKLTGDDPETRRRSREIIDLALLTPVSIVILVPVLTLLKINAVQS